MLIKRLYRHFPFPLFTWRRLMGVNREPEMKLLSILCHADMTSLDVGAKFGMYTYRLGHYSKQVLAFEPIKDLYTALGNIFFGRNVDVVPFALSHSSGEVFMRTPKYPSGNPCYGRSSIESENPLLHEDVEGWDEFTVRTLRLDDLNLSDVGFIKIDVEGHEQSVLAGGSRTIQQYKPALLVEANESHLQGAVEKLFDWARLNGYLVFFMDDGNICPAADYDLNYHHHVRQLENFILVHGTDRGRLERLGQAVPD